MVKIGPMSLLADFHPAVRTWFADAPRRADAAAARGLAADPRGPAHADRGARPARARRSPRSSRRSTSLLRQGPALPDETQVLYVSPLRALSNDVQKNLQGAARRDPRARPVASRGARARAHGRHAGGRARRDGAPAAAHPGHDARVALPPAHERGRPRDARARSGPSSWTRSTPSCATSAAATWRSRSSGSRPWPGRPVQRIGLSATQKPLDEVGRFLVGAGPRVRARRRRAPSASSTSAIEVPPSPLADGLLARAVGGDLRAHGRARPRAPDDARLREHAQDGRAHRGAADAAARRGRGHEPPRQPLAGAPARRRAAAEGRARCAPSWPPRRSSSGIDIGDVDLVDPGRRHALDRDVPAARRPRGPRARGAIPKGRLFPLTLDELVEGAALLRCVRERRCSTARPSPPRPLDILAQQIVAACVAGGLGRGRRSSTSSGAPGPTATSRASEFDARRRAPHARAAGRCSTATASTGA